ncbi:MAG TPA: TSUP family transporter [Verrucomicrobiota bacterium]|nr:TSUP family transporter [Verrucomicrobiota bacterium]HNT13481.1 TSUP family transporter [Verrucomicrobiota bacterium]
MDSSLAAAASAWQFPLLFGVGLVSGFVDAIAGGGGLITLPTLLLLGGDPQVALGTNKLQATFGAASATWHYAKAGAVELRDCWRGGAMTFMGAGVGTLAVQQIGTHALKAIIPLLLVAVAVYSLRNLGLEETKKPPRLSRWCFDLIFGLVLGGYDGFFGPGTGTFWTIAFVAALGFNLLRATAYTKAMNLSSNVCSLFIFLWAGKVDFLAGGCMGLGQLIGARFGSRMVVRRGTTFIRPVFITVVLVLTAKLLLEAYMR